MTITKCDRCGKIIERTKHVTNYAILYHRQRYLDLCDDCYDSLLDWIHVDKDEPEEELREIKAYRLDEPNPNFDPVL